MICPHKLHADAQDFDSHTSDLEEIFEKYLVLILVNCPLPLFGSVAWTSMASVFPGMKHPPLM